MMAIEEKEDIQATKNCVNINILDITSRELTANWHDNFRKSKPLDLHNNNHPQKTWKHFYLCPPPLCNSLNFCGWGTTTNHGVADSSIS